MVHKGQSSLHIAGMGQNRSCGKGRIKMVNMGLNHLYTYRRCNENSISVMQRMVVMCVLWGIFLFSLVGGGGFCVHSFLVDHHVCSTKFSEKMGLLALHFLQLVSLVLHQSYFNQ